MNFLDLQEYIEALKKKGELKIVGAKVDPVYEMGHIADRLIKSGGPAVLFENPKGSTIPVAMNLFGTKSRMEFALGVKDLNDLGKRVEDLINVEAPMNFWDKLKNIMKLKEFANFLPKIVENPPSQAVIDDDVDLNSLPVLKTWPEDGGKFITLPMVFTKNPILDPLIGAAIGSISAGNPIISYIISGELLHQGVSLTAVTAFVLSWVSVGVIQMPAECAILGKKFAIYRNILSFIFAIIIAVIIGAILG